MNTLGRSNKRPAKVTPNDFAKFLLAEWPRCEKLIKRRNQKFAKAVAELLANPGNGGSLDVAPWNIFPAELRSQKR